MSSAGHVADMIARMRVNRELTKRKNPFKKKEEAIYEHKHIGLQFQEPTIEQKKRTFLWIKREKQRQLLLDRWMIILYLLLFIFCFGWFVFQMN